MLSLSIITPDTFLFNVSTSSTNVTAIVQAKKKTSKKKSSNCKTKKGKKVTAKDKKEITVYITPTGTCYHSRKCGKGTYNKSTLSHAKSLGLKLCKRCY